MTTKEALGQYLARVKDELKLAMARFKSDVPDLEEHLKLFMEDVPTTGPTIGQDSIIFIQSQDVKQFQRILDDHDLPSLIISLQGAFLAGALTVWKDATKRSGVTAEQLADAMCDVMGIAKGEIDANDVGDE